MRIYLSNYWKKTCVFSILIILVIIIATTIFCVWSHDTEDYILIAGSLFFVFLFCYLTLISMKLVRYIVKENNRIVMYSFIGKKLSALNLESDIYYEILPLIEGMYSTQDYIVISNSPFESYQKKRYTGIGKICKSIDENGNQIIMPYRKQVSGLLDISLWYKIN